VTQTLKLRPREDKRIKGGHVWIYSNEVDTAATPLKGFDAGEEVVVTAHDGRPLGRALVNPHALICARLVSRDAEVGLDRALLSARVEAALALRERLYPGTGCYRLVYGEGDGLSGMVVDRFGDVLSVQLTTAGMEARRDLVVDVLRDLLAPRTIVLKHDAKSRAVEGLAEYVEVIGEALAEPVSLVENGVPFRAPLADGQKTGWFFDHRENRARLAPFCAGARVLDAFSYAGGWGLQALAFGADSLLAVDGSAPALEVLEANAAHQGVSDRVDARRGDAFEVLAGLADAHERFGVVVIDPPALVKRRKDLRAGQRAYERLAVLGMRLVADGGLLAFGSCSLHFDRALLREALRGAARNTERSARLLGVFGAGPDHPVHPAIPETDYLKAALVHVQGAGRGGAF
jgi:23S rRNA (cytosine1962-C5)-methyltransferase